MMENTDGAEDLRVKRSRASLRQALFELTVEKGFNHVTVRDIAKRAEVNRSTFYRHYVDKYDLLHQYFDQLQKDVAEAAAQAEHAASNHEERVPAGLRPLLEGFRWTRLGGGEYAGTYTMRLIILLQVAAACYLRKSAPFNTRSMS